MDEWHAWHQRFLRDGDRVFLTYFVNHRGDEAMGSTWSYLVVTALGRQGEWEDSPDGYPQEPPYHDLEGDVPRHRLRPGRSGPRGRQR